MDELDPVSLERRKEPRYRLNKMLGLQVTREDFRADLRVLVLDISGTGLRVSSPQQLPEENDLAFVLSLPDKRPSVQGQLKVRWQRFLPVSENHEVGLEFLELAEENWRALRDFVGSLLSQPEKQQENLCNPWRFGKFPY
ncbi:PilZ domain-containing protein [bacterium CPR1]|nr:PilZ domain-containing protein [bacterium CPR1]